MKIKELKKELDNYDPELPVYVEIRNNDGCATCGSGATTSEGDVELTDLETKVIIRAI